MVRFYVVLAQLVQGEVLENLYALLVYKSTINTWCVEYYSSCPRPCPILIKDKSRSWSGQNIVFVFDIYKMQQLWSKICNKLVSG